VRREIREHGIYTECCKIAFKAVVPREIHMLSFYIGYVSSNAAFLLAVQETHALPYPESQYFHSRNFKPKMK